MSLIPQHLANFKLYGGAAFTELLGVVDVELPKFEGMSETVTGAGIGGEYESIVLGHTKSMAIKFKGRIATADMLALGIGTVQTFEARAATQQQESTTGGVTLAGWRVRVTGQIKMANPGKLEPSKMMDAEIEMSCSSVHVFVSGVELLVVEPFNFVHRVNGVDLLAATRALVA